MYIILARVVSQNYEVTLKI